MAQIHTQRHLMIVLGALALGLKASISAYAGEALGQANDGSPNCHPSSFQRSAALSTRGLANTTTSTPTGREALCVKPAPVCLRSSVCDIKRSSFLHNES